MSAAADLIRQARAELDREYPKAWVPHEQGHPTEIAGIVKRLETANTRQYGPKHVVIIEDENGAEWSIWLLHAALVTQMTRVRPAAGEPIAVRYLGKRLSQATGNEYDDYKVASLRADGAQLDWDAIDPAGGPTFPATQPAAAATLPAAAATPIPQTQPPVGAGALCPDCGGPAPYHTPACAYSIPF